MNVMELLYIGASFAYLMWEQAAADASQGTNVYWESQRHTTDMAHCLNNVSLCFRTERMAPEIELPSFR
jgi:hypothetical protein